MNPSKKGVSLVALGALLWGGSGVAAQFLLQQKGFSTEWLVMMRMTLAGILLLLLDAAKNRESIFSVWRNRTAAKRLLFFSLFGMLGVQYTYFSSIEHGNAAAASVLQYLMPIIVVLWLALKSRSLPSLRESVCVLLAFVGTFLILTRGSLSTLAIPPIALFWGVASSTPYSPNGCWTISARLSSSAGRCSSAVSCSCPFAHHGTSPASWTPPPSPYSSMSSSSVRSSPFGHISKASNTSSRAPSAS